MLEDKINEYKATKKMLKNTPAQYKRQFPWLKEVDSLALSNVQLHLETAYKNFFREPRIGFPKFKSKHRSTNSYTTNVVNGNIRMEKGRLKLPKMTTLKVKQHRDIPAGYKLKSVTVSREPSGKYYASLFWDFYLKCLELHMLLSFLPQSVRTQDTRRLRVKLKYLQSSQF